MPKNAPEKNAPRPCFLHVWLPCCPLMAWLLTLILWALRCVPVAADEIAIAPLVAAAKRAGLRVFAGTHLTLATDRAVREGDGIEHLPQLFDQAFTEWCAHFNLDPAKHAQWQAFGCLVVDRERFRTAGLLPAVVPDFANGFCDRNRFWMMDQSSPAYRRHLLLHEGVHAFTLTLRSLDTPPWYTEGIAEYLATHRIVAGRSDAAQSPSAANGAFESTPIPFVAADVEQLGRIETIRALHVANRAPALADIFNTPSADHHNLGAYAGSWAAVAMLARHPDYARAFAILERGPLDQTFTTRLTGSADWDAARAARDFAAFTAEIDYGYDFSRSAIDWSPGLPLAQQRAMAVAGNRGWQNSGWRVAEGARVSFVATGRYRIGSLPRDVLPVAVLESEAEGISLRWYRGRPLGKLLIAQWFQPTTGDTAQPGFRVVAEGASGSFIALADSTLYCKVNEPPGELADNAGGLRVELVPTPEP